MWEEERGGWTQSGGAASGERSQVAFEGRQFKVVDFSFDFTDTYHSGLIDEYLVGLGDAKAG
jgi:hypothetical protein